jgi:hypothetical protein
MISEEEMTELYEKILVNTAELIKVYDPLAVAAIMIAQSLGIYKTALPDADYDLLVKNILSKKDQVIPFANKGTLH